MIIYESPYQSVHIDLHKKELLQVWHPESENLTEKILENELKEALHSIIKYDDAIPYFLLDACKFQFLITVEKQEWIAIIFFNQLITLKGIKKLAHISPESMGPEFSLDQVMDDYVLLNSYKCSNIKEARKWFYQ